MTIKSKYKALVNSQKKYESAIGSMESEISSKVEFEFTIFWQSSDGFVMEAFEFNAPLRLCLEIIIEKGILSFNEYKKITI